MTNNTYEFSDSLSRFLLKNPTSNEIAWLMQLDQDDLYNLIDILLLVVEDRPIPGLNENDCLNKFTDVNLLAFKVKNIGKKNRISTMSPEMRTKLLVRILAEAQSIINDTEYI